MLVEMAIDNKVVQVEPFDRNQKYFSKILILFSLVVIGLVILNFLEILKLSEIGTNILLLLSGIWLLKVGIEEGFYKKRKGILKKYI